MANMDRHLMTSAQRRVDPQASKGFTLIELMIVVAVVAILAAIALPSYQDSIRKGRRGQAKSDLVELAQRAERFRTINNGYNAGTGFWASVPNTDRRSPRGAGTAHYNITEAQAAGTFTLTATPQGGQANDARCMTLTINQAGAKTESGSGSLQDCW